MKRQYCGPEWAALQHGPTFMIRGDDDRLFLAVAVETSGPGEGVCASSSMPLGELFRQGRARAALTAVEVNPAIEAAKKPSKPKPKPKPAPAPQPVSPPQESPGIQTDTPGIQTG